MTAHCRVRDCPWSGTYADEAGALSALESHYHVNHRKEA